MPALPERRHWLHGAAKAGFPFLPVNAADNSGSGGEPARFRALRILIVEDEAIAALDLELIVARLGHHVVDVVDTGPAAISGAVDFRPDLVLMDIRLADDTDGIEAAIEIRRRLGTPSIFLTAHSDVQTHRRAMFARPLDFIVKPFSAPIVEAALQRMNGGSERQGS